MFSKWICLFDLRLVHPIATAVLFIQTIIGDIRSPYGGYPQSLLFLGWVLLGAGIVLALSTRWKQGPSTLADFSMDDIEKDHKESIPKIDMCSLESKSAQSDSSDNVSHFNNVNTESIAIRDVHGPDDVHE